MAEVKILIESYTTADSAGKKEKGSRQKVVKLTDWIISGHYEIVKMKR